MPPPPEPLGLIVQHFHGSYKGKIFFGVLCCVLFFK